MFDELLLNFVIRNGAKWTFMVFQLDSKGAKVCKSCRSRQEISNEYLLAKIGVDTADNEPLQVCQKFAKS